MNVIRNYLLIALFLFVGLFGAASFADAARADEFSRLEGSTLIFEERTETRRVENVPKGLTAEQASGLVTGKIPEVLLEKDDRKMVAVVPVVVAEKVTNSHTITYSADGWNEVIDTRLFSEQNWSSTFVFLAPIIILLGSSMFFLVRSRSLMLCGIGSIVIIGGTLGLIIVGSSFWVLVGWILLSNVVLVVTLLKMTEMVDQVVYLWMGIFLAQTFMIIVDFEGNSVLATHYAIAVTVIITLVMAGKIFHIWWKRTDRLAR